MEKITTREIINAIKRNIWLILVPSLLIGGLALFFNLIKAEKYEANSVLIVTSNDQGPISYNKLLLNEKLANVYGQFLESDDLYADVANYRPDSFTTGQMIKDRLDFTVNPQGGTIAFSYQSYNEQEARDTLTLITENFRKYAKAFLNMENIEYLQEVTVKEASKTRKIIFTILGFIVGALVGLVMMLIKEILTDKIRSADDIRAMGIEVLADLTADNPSELAKLKRKVELTSTKALIGISPLNKEATLEQILGYLSEELKAPVFDLENLAKDGQSLGLIKEEIRKTKEINSYVLISEESFNSPSTIEISDIEDYKIILVPKSYTKTKLASALSELERLGIKVLGVIYHK